MHRKERDGKSRDKIKCILLLDKGWSYNQITEALFLDYDTLRNYTEKYNQGNIDHLLENLYNGRPAKLSKDQINSLNSHLESLTYHTAESVCEYVKDEYSIIYTKKGMISLLHKLEFEYKKPKLIPGNPDIEKQKAFIEQYKELKSTLGQNDEILFVDGMHPVHNVRPGYGWIKKGTTKHIQSNTGRERININAALNVKKSEVVYKAEETINGESMFSLLIKVLDKYPKAEKIHVILDNAGYNKSRIMNVFRSHKRLKLVFLPPYSPNLNLIERLWKFYHKKVTCNRYYKTFLEFKKATLEFMENIPFYEKELKTLLAENFSIIQPNIPKFNLA